MGNTNNQGVSNLNFSLLSTNTKVDTNGKIGSCYANNSNSVGGLISDATIDLGQSQSMFCWFRFTSLESSSSLGGGLVSQHRYGSNAGMGITIRYVSSTTGYLSVNTGNGSSRTFNTYYGTTLLQANTWYHGGYTYDGQNIRIYVNGVLEKTQAYTGMYVPAEYLTVFCWSMATAGAVVYGDYHFNGAINDVRAYDHCLSAKEVKDISKGLVVHYKLETHKMKNITSYPTFNTSSAGGGWNHWEPSGLNKGSYAQNTDKQYIFNKNNTYSHKVVNGSGSSYDYIMYQSPAYDTEIASGGCRTFVAIIKDEFSQPITNSICHPGWNAPNNSIGPVSVWNDIVPLGDGFYLCKCEGLCQTGSNNLIGIQVKSGHTIYISEAYIENYATKMGILPFYAGDTDVMEDSSGYGRHGLHYSGTVVSVANSGNGRYDSAIENLNGYTGKAEVNMPPLSAITFSWWANYKVFGAQTSGLFSTSNVSTDPTDYNTTACNMRDSYFDMCNTAGSCKRLSATGIELNKWHHYCITYDGTTERFYVDGVQTASVAQTGALKDWKYLYISYSRAGGVVRMCRGAVSDFRVYCTALSTDDVKEMYETAASVDNKGNFHCYELKEV